MEKISKQVYENAKKRYYDNYESQYEFESRIWEETHPNAMIRWEKLPGEIRLEKLKALCEI